MLNRGKYRIFVGNTQEISNREVKEKFSEFGPVVEVDLKGYVNKLKFRIKVVSFGAVFQGYDSSFRSYGFVGYDDEVAAKAAITAMDMSDFKGRKLNVEMSGGRPRTNAKDGKGTTKLHVAGVGMDADQDEVRKLFEDYGDVPEVHLMPGRDVAFVHIDEKSAEKAMVGLNGADFNGEKLKVEYGTLSRKPQYDKRAPKVKLYFWFIHTVRWLQHIAYMLYLYDIGTILPYSFNISSIILHYSNKLTV